MSAFAGVDGGSSARVCAKSLDTKQSFCFLNTKLKYVLKRSFQYAMISQDCIQIMPTCTGPIAEFVPILVVRIRDA